MLNMKHQIQNTLLNIRIDLTRSNNHLFQGASGIIFPIIRDEGVRQMFFPATIPAYYRAPSKAHSIEGR